LRHIIIAATLIRFSISLLISSASKDKKTCSILLLCFGRVLIIGQVGYKNGLAGLVLTVLGGVYLGELFSCTVQIYVLDFVGCLQLLSRVDHLPRPRDCSRSSCGRYDQNRSSFICVGVGKALLPIHVAALVAKKGLVQAVRPLTRIGHECI
jgi:hypothetical protein